MGTNYYVRENACPTCHHSEDKIHIGKSSAGWCFSLHVIPERGLNSLDDWMAFLMDPKHPIFNEYGVAVKFENLMDTITKRSWPTTREKPSGYKNWADFHAQNQSVPGPEGLVRHAIGDHCVGHGEGTWDLIPGEFS